ncbi:MAG: TrkH family potassium uptake protein [Sporichthyaceae bacterium]
MIGDLPTGGRRGRAPGSLLQHPARVIATAFGTVISIGTVLLWLPVATTDGEHAHFVDALFTATSAACVTGLAVVDTGDHWSTFGEVVIMALMQVGGLGIMTMATLLALLLSRRLGLRTRLVLQAETKSLQLRDLRKLLLGIAAFSFATEAIVATILTIRFATRYDEPWGEALYSGVFHSISSFNSGGLSLYGDSMVRYVADPVVSLTVCAAVILGGLGFPVVFELVREWRRPRDWSVLTRITLAASGALLVLGTAIFTAAEWSNRSTLGPLSTGDKLVAGFFASVMPRSGGLNSIDYSALTPESLLTTDILMFIGGGSASTAGGIKVTTFGLLAFVIWAEMRGESHVHVGRRRVPEANQRQALAIALMGIGIVMAGTLLLLGLTEHDLDSVLFEATSAFATCGLSTGITADLGRDGQLVVVAMMFVGRIGPLTFASALALRERTRRFELPEERTIVG